jgi:hypothetical protein
VVEAACFTDGDKILVVTPFDGVPLLVEGLTVEFIGVGAARRTIPCFSKKYFSVLCSKSSMSSDISKKQKYRMKISQHTYIRISHLGRKYGMEWQ